MRPPPRSVYTSDDPTDLLRTSQVRIAAVVCSGVSTVASLLALYWFCRMEKKFRHHLIVILFYGGLVSSAWFVVFTTLTTKHGPLVTDSAFCQMSGFFIQYGTETCDYAVLVIAIHSAMQVFNPCPPATSDGLQPFRRYVYAGAFFVPALMASLVFVNPHYGYQSLGAFCMLPIRPFWYRLALQWVPRYLIALIIFGLAIAIYSYVGIKFRSYHQMSQSVHDSQIASNMSSLRSDRGPEAMVSPRAAGMIETEPEKLRRTSLLADGIIASPRRESAMSYISAEPIAIRTASITPSSTYSDPEDAIPPPPRRPSLALIPSGYTIHQSSPPGQGHTLTSIRPNKNARTSTYTAASTSASYSPPADQDPDLISLPPTPIFHARAASPSHPGQRQMARQRARCHRQLRLLFIYPLVYTLVWLIPFVMHCMNYQDYYALHPVWFLRLGSIVCITSIGFVNFVVFTVREKPWKSIPTSDGTLWGSFAVWRGDVNAGGTRASSLASGGGRLSIQRTVSEGTGVRIGRIGARTSGSASDKTRMEMGQARVRLGLEREERLEAMRAREAEKGVTGSNGGQEGGGEMSEKAKGKRKAEEV